MKARKYVTGGLALILTLTIVPSGSAHRRGSHYDFGTILGLASIGAEAHRAKDLANAQAPLESVAPIPNLDFEMSDADETIEVVCGWFAYGRFTGALPIKGVRGRTVSTMFLLDNVTGQFETRVIDAGTFKTGTDGYAERRFNIPNHIFADGFESGDVSAWVHTSSIGLNNKKVRAMSQGCGIPSFFQEHLRG